MIMKIFLASIFLLSSFGLLAAQDTVQVPLEEFIERGIQNSGQVEANQQEVLLAKNRINQVQDERYLPEFSLTTQHGLVPEVENPMANTETLEYNFSNLSLFTRAHIELLQPIFTWGALRNAVKASRAAADAAVHKFEITKNETALRLYKLYQSYLLSLEISRILDEAQNKLSRIVTELNERQDEEEMDVDQSELFKLKVFQSEFAVRAGEVRVNAEYIQNVWNYVMGAENSGTVYMPTTYFLDPVENPIKELPFYRTKAVTMRPEVNALEAGIEAAEFGLEATKSKNYPALFFGARATYLYTPNPPRENYAIELNPRNYATAVAGIGIRQNLDFFGMKYDVTRSKIQYDQIKYSKQAAIDGIILQLNEKYKNASVSQIAVEKIEQALITAKRWLRQEQLDYDLGTGNTKDLVDALQKELELRVQYKQAIFNFNKDFAELFRVSAIPVTQLTTNFQENEETN